MRRNPGTNRVSDEWKEAVLRAYDLGFSQRLIVYLFGVSRQSIRAWAKERDEASQEAISPHVTTIHLNKTLQRDKK
jgi:hypothetical protein